MKKVVITKKQIIKAIMEEPYLAGGHYLNLSDLYYNDTVPLSETEECRVCAIGSVLRQKLIKYSIDARKFVRLTSDLDNIPSHSTRDDKLSTYFLEQKDYLSALSKEFESYVDYGRIKVTNRIRVKLSKWVDKNFPNRFTVELPI